MSRRGARPSDGLLEQIVERHATAIAQIHARGEIAIVVHKPSKRAAHGARLLGWDGRVAAFAITRSFAERYLAYVDDVTRRWVERQQPDQAKVFIVTAGGSVLVNFTPGGGCTIEPGSLDESVRRAS